MIFEDGFFHGDPHPGNLLVTKDGTIVVLDFGIAGTLRPEKRQNFMRFLAAVMNEDTELLIRSLEGFGVVIPAENREHLQDDLFVLMQDLDLSNTISRFNFTLFANELSEVMRRYRIRVPMNLMLLLKVLVMILDIGIRLDPEFNIEEELSPYLVKVAKENTFSAASAKRASVTLLETTDAIFDMPRHLDLMLRRFSTGTMRLELVDKDLREFEMSLDEASDKLMMALVVGIAGHRVFADPQGQSPALPPAGFMAGGPRVRRCSAGGVLCSVPYRVPEVPGERLTTRYPWSVGEDLRSGDEEGKKAGFSRESSAVP